MLKLYTEVGLGDVQVWFATLLYFKTTIVYTDILVYYNSPVVVLIVVMLECERSGHPAGRLRGAAI